ncbi:MAG: UDP-glucose 4-epimerase [Spirochaetes bacterium ADurb.Bin110]|jgi:UDP-glucose 4-epimerase|nr:polysaccharide biosynthesis protein [Spirochaetia bacterium]OQB97348.1 MAG: UDP-glucose 4-epimerase [Spirochaetes bacterium ADurb.Bin110]HPG96194.1 polysaccharide biosynthesis protein [Rectinema sp.]HPN03217.1 polysaccharide biosynthesis protein [Rectinema sp.]
MNSSTLLISGGTGSFGNAILKKYLNRDDFQEIRIFSRDEKKQDDMRHLYKSEKIKYYIGDVRDIQSVKAAMQGVDYVFHAAALKQVPSCEFYPVEAVKTNVLGADNVLTAAIEAGVKRVVVLSTDKAVYPINAMGMSKALMEKVMIAKSRGLDEKKQIICGTRYGNVMASRGSVIPLFIDQIMSGKPITITDPEMTRFMLHLDEAVELVEYAFSHAHNGDIFVKKAPACTLADLAEALKELLNADNEVHVIGTRHGEKVYETLVNREEMAKAIDCGDYYRIPADTRDLNYDKYFSNGDEKVKVVAEYTSHNTRRLNVEEMKELLLTLDCVHEARKERGLE